ncbi:MAG: GlxA family transcriptional regulator [Gammaproteobacteria bacterium]|nr:GlxA family transcriptional regulator [Gammaproteobacteria bacterium]
MSLFSVSEQKLRVCLLVLPETSMMSLASTLDPMRAANRIASRGLFEWQLLTIDDQPATLTCGIPVAPQGKIDAHIRGDLLFVIAGFNQYKHVNRQQIKIIKQLCSRFQAIGGIEAGSWLLARCGLLDGKQATTHWEDQEEFSVQFPRVVLKPDRFVIDGKIFTTGGASPTFDLMLYLIRTRYGYPLALEVSSAFIYDGVHSATDTQPLVSLGMLENHEPRVAAAIQIMEQHIDEIIAITVIAEKLDLSTRMLEYLFAQTLNLSPAAYYRRLRLQTARRMVVDTRLRLQEIAIRTGFNSLSSFSRLFRQYYQQSPGECRRQAR